MAIRQTLFGGVSTQQFYTSILKEDICFWKKCFFDHFRTLSQRYLTFWWSFFGECLKAGLYTLILREENFFYKSFFTTVAHWAKNLRLFGERFSAMVSNLRSTCPEEALRQMFFFWKKKLFSSFSDNRQKNLAFLVIMFRLDFQNCILHGQKKFKWENKFFLIEFLFRFRTLSDKLLASWQTFFGRVVVTGF